MLYAQPTHCPFAPRCPYAFDRCWQENPPLMNTGNDHRVACWWDVKEGEAAPWLSTKVLLSVGTW